ncbi:GPW/gp25 family protein [Polycladidibacter hongkongensis]|uniref:GPW/gp25 family protein n=1 Tax=Polycladidibacter hongkongensis TaxID=1647556 RepID=UPI000832C812|nr:GPW/gp25 family protein [Pseudovibrio hongkongensis]
MSGLNRHNLQLLDGFAHVQQSISEVILPTTPGERVLREEFGTLLASVLMQPQTRKRQMLLAFLVALAIELYEPRFAVRRIQPIETIEDKRAGNVGLRISGDYLPRGHLGDGSVASSHEFSL